MKYAVFSLLAALCLTDASDVGSSGYSNITTQYWTLELDNVNQVASRLIALPGPNAGNAAFNFLLPSKGREGNGNYFLGDIQLRFRQQNAQAWTDVASHQNRQSVTITKGSVTGFGSGVITSADLTTSLGSNLPLKVNRTWSSDRDSIVMTFNITNVANYPIEFGGIGIPLPYNDNWIGKNQQDTWTQSVVSDPAISMDCGYVLSNRLTGQAPTMITSPVNRTPLQQYRINYNTEPGYPPVWYDKTPIDFEYEGIYSWWMTSSGLENIDQNSAADQSFTRGGVDNLATNLILQPQSSYIAGLRFYTTTGPRAVEDRLSNYGYSTIVGVPGFVVNSKDQVKLLVRSNAIPSIASVLPANIKYSGFTQISPALYQAIGSVVSGTFGRTRVTISFSDGTVGTAHYTVVNPAATQLDNLGSFRLGNQWFTNTTDYFGRGPSIISYDNKLKKQITDDNRAWIAGLSDEAGSGAYVSAAAKQLGRPNKNEIAKLEAFAKQTLWPHLQISTAGSTYGGVKKSLFYYDPSLEGKGLYDSNINHGGTWNQAEANRLDRSYNYPHPTVVYWVLYRLARNYVGLTTNSWTWYLDRAYDTIIGMKNNAGITGYAQFGLMEGTYFLQVLQDLQREGSTNSTLQSRASTVEAFMKQRADLWKSETYPYASEFPWDNTGQEEVYAWADYFGYSDTAAATIETLIAVMSSVPHWGYSGTGRDLWDFLYSAALGPGARIERCFHHYKGAQSGLPLLNQFMKKPNDIRMLRAGYGSVLGSLATIGNDGFGSTGFHSRPDYLNWDPSSGDNGVNIALHALATRAVVVNFPEVGGWSGFGAQVSQSGTSITIVPTDSFTQRVFIADNALYLELDAGYFTKVTYDTSSKEVMVTLAPANSYTPKARLRQRTTASTSSSGTYVLQGTFPVIRGASVIDLGSSPITVSLKRS